MGKFIEQQRNLTTVKKFGIIADTHGTVPAAVFDIFFEVDQIWHAGDIGDLSVIAELETIAPVTGVHGNVDDFPIIHRFPESKLLRLNQSAIFIIHQYWEQRRQKYQSSINDSSLKIDVIIFGHTHTPYLHKRKSLTLFNPGSASFPRQGYQPSVGILTVDEDYRLNFDIRFWDQ
ncbi:MAG: metallophosphoesterase family protein [bacterium]|nr:metallophosphoesterase family protein [bacterium]